MNPAKAALVQLLALLSACAPRTAAPPTLPPTVTAVSAVPPSPAPPAPTAVTRRALDDDDLFGALFLTQEEVGASMQHVEEGSLADNASFRAAKGLRARSIRWSEGSQVDVVHQITDFRWVFPDDDHAKSFFTEWTTKELAAYVPLEGIAALGDDGRTFSCPRAENNGRLQDMYIFTLRRGIVVAQVAVTRGRLAPAGSLTPELAVQFGRLAERRIAAALDAASAQPRR